MYVIWHVLLGAFMGTMFGVTILDALFFHSDDIGAIVGFFLGIAVGLITGSIHWIGVKLGIFNKPRKCSKCGSRNTTIHLEKVCPGTIFFGLYKCVCQDCGNTEIIYS